MWLYITPGQNRLPCQVTLDIITSAMRKTEIVKQAIQDYYQKIFQTVFGIVADVGLAEDITQEVVEKALITNHPDASKPLDVLAKVGGFEIGGLAGVMLAAAAYRVPAVIDGFISGAAALIATAMAPNLKDYLIAGHVSAEAGHRVLLEYLGLKPLLDLDMRLGEGTGAALGIYLAEAAARVLAEMPTFSEAGVSEKSEEQKWDS